MAGMFDHPARTQRKLLQHEVIGWARDADQQAWRRGAPRRASGVTQSMPMSSPVSKTGIAPRPASTENVLASTRLASTTATVLGALAARAIHGQAEPVAESHAPVIRNVRLSIVRTRVIHSDVSLHRIRRCAFALTSVHHSRITTPVTPRRRPYTLFPRRKNPGWIQRVLDRFR
jgi:hypothetical protein